MIHGISVSSDKVSKGREGEGTSYILVDLGLYSSTIFEMLVVMSFYILLLWENGS